MPGTVAGGQKTFKTNLQLYGKDYYRDIGRKGGSAPHQRRYFKDHPEMASAAGRKGGLVSRRGQPKNWHKLNEKKLRAAEDHLMEVAEQARAERERAKLTKETEQA